MLGVVVVAYKSAQMTIDFVKRERGNIDVPCILCIVDNASVEEECEYMAESLQAEVVDEELCVKDKDNGIYIIPSKENLGFARGNNLGVTFLKRNFDIDYLLFSNNDIEIRSRNCVSTLIQRLKEDERIGAIGPRIVSLDGSYQLPHDAPVSIYRQIGWMLFPFLRKRHQKETATVPKAQEIPPSKFTYWVQGSFFVMSAKVFLEVGMFDPNTFLYAEEPILAEKLKRIGKRMYYESSVEVLHYEGGTIVKQNGNNWSLTKAMESNCYYYKHYLHYNIVAISLYKWLFSIQNRL